MTCSSQKAPLAPHVLTRPGCHDGAAVARLDGPGADAAGEDGGDAEDAGSALHLRPARRDDGQVDAGDGRHRLRVLRDR